VNVIRGRRFLLCEPEMSLSLPIEIAREPRPHISKTVVKTDVVVSFSRSVRTVQLQRRLCAGPHRRLAG
jgi:hypothetical protein